MRRLAVALAGLWCAGASSILMAQEEPPFTVTPRLTVGTTFTDNVGLRESGEEISDLILRVSPGVSATADGNRVSGQADYSLRNLYYLREDDRNQATHLFNLRGNAEVLEDFFFLDASAQRREQAFSLIDPAGLGGGVGENEATEVTNWRVSPYVTQRLGRFANVTARYAHDRTEYGRGVRDQYTDTYMVNMDSGTLFGRFFWNADYSLRETEYQEDADNPTLGDDVRLETISGTAGWELTRNLRVFGTVGEERNEYSSAVDDREGSFWNAGFTWAPSRNTSLEATAGERFFGDTYSLSLQHRRRRTLWEASYYEEISTTQRRGRRDFTELSGAELQELFGEIETLEDLFVVTREEVSVFERAQTSVTLDLRRSRWQLLAYRSERRFLQDPFDTARDQTQTGVQGTLVWELGPTVDWNTSLRYARVDFEERDEGHEILRSGRTGLSREFGPNVDGSVTYRHQQRTSEGGAGREFRENAIIATMTMTF